MLARSLQHEVPHRSRVKGADYFARGAVLEVSAAPRGIAAVVRGTRDYAVTIQHENGGFSAGCECPFFRDRDEICKHIWAVLLTPETEALLAAAGRIPARPWLDPADVAVNARGPRSSAMEPWRHALGEVVRVADAAAAEAGSLPARMDALTYVLDVAASLQASGAVLRLMTRHRKRDGTWARPRPATVARHDVERLSDERDREILALLGGADRQWAYGAFGAADPGTTFELGDLLQRRMLPLMCATHRLAVAPAGIAGELLPIEADHGSEWRFELTVASEGSGHAVSGAFACGDERLRLDELVLLLHGGFIFSRTTMLHADVQKYWPWILQLRRTAPLMVPADGIGALREALARTGVDPAGLPGDLQFARVHAVPRPGVLIRRQPVPSYVREHLDAAVQFDYDGTVLDADGAPFFDVATRRLIVRDTIRERESFERLGALGFRKVWSDVARRQVLGIRADEFPQAVRTLALEGWRVEAEGRMFRAPRDLQLEVRSGIDWFELHGQIDFGDGVSAPLPELLAAFRRGEGTITLDDGTKGLVPEEWARRFAGLAEYGERAADHVRYRPSQAALLDALLAAQPAARVDDVFRRAREALATFDGIGPLDPAEDFHGRLREYQREALGWFEFLRRFGFGGCLADDMGLGKTVMVLAMLDARRAVASAPSLVVVPRSLVFNWVEEAAKFAPALRVLDYTGTARSTETLREHDLVLTTYGTLRRDVAQVHDLEFDYVILDEAQAVKNANTASAKAVRLLRARHRLALSGTPVENHLGELWSLFDFLNPGLLGTSAAFARATAGRARQGPEELATLARAVRPFILRRTKAQVAPELPERTEQTIHCELDAAQRRLYDELREHYRRTLLAHVDRHGMNRSKLQVLEALLRLRQAACHPGLIDEGRRGDPAVKFDVLLARLGELAEEGHKALVFSQFTSLLALLRPRLEALDLAYEYLDGRTRDRAARVQRFQQDPEVRVFLISLKAGGLGLNLTAAEYVFLLDPWWNPATEAQAIDRAHRIGQTRHVFAYRLIAQDTVEEKVAALQDTKRELADAILTADEGLVRGLSREDLAWLVG